MPLSVSSNDAGVHSNMLMVTAVMVLLLPVCLYPQNEGMARQGWGEGVIHPKVAAVREAATWALVVLDVVVFSHEVTWA